MKQYIIPALRLSLLFLLVFAVAYPALIWAVAQAAPNKGRGETVAFNGRVVGYANEGQRFTEDRYFWTRPSAVNYNAAGSAGSNKGPNNPEYLQTVKDRLDSFLVHNPAVKKENVPVELITASGSGLDPDLSPAGAYAQVARVAQARGLQEATLRAWVDKHLEKSLLGPSKINVLRLNLELDGLKNNL